MPTDKPALKIKNARLDLFVLHLYSTDMAAVLQELADKLTQTPDFFAATPVALGLAGIADSEAVPDFADLARHMRQLGLHLAGILGGSAAQQAAAAEAGLGLFRDSRAVPRSPAAAPEPVAPPEPAAFPEPAAPAEAVVERPPAPTIPVERAPAKATLVIDKPVRTGQRVYAKDADLVVLAVVNSGAEVLADGDIHVYAPLRGRALAGAHGKRTARIYVQAMEAELVAIAGLFQVFEDGVPEAVRGKPAQVSQDGDRLVVAPLPAPR